ncbi:hypothetical protein [Kitasatospora azatica]|uniref:hypothetical protein n=1 Tax=Kitasatospora azatica TaxID=58347 RepID=UPI000566EB43|nr:hypothetical protein [Kitasatospora azatica]
MESATFFTQSRKLSAAWPVHSMFWEWDDSWPLMSLSVSEALVSAAPRSDSTLGWPFLTMSTSCWWVMPSKYA